MNAFFRVDASIQIGIGHVMRCITIADALSQQGATCFFICRQHIGNMLNFIESKGHTVLALPHPQTDWQKTEYDSLVHSEWLGTSQDEDAQQSIAAIQSIRSANAAAWLVVDHYALDYRWNLALRAYTNKVMVIDDLADRQHDCDLLLDQTFGRSKYGYQRLVPKHCTILTGSHYALLRPEFAQWREYSLQRRLNPELNHLLITFGGVDKDNVTADILDAIANSSLPFNCQITIVMGANAPWLDNITQKVNALPWKTEVKINVENMAQLMANSDLCIGAAGSTTWERCCLGLPTILLTLADNQKDIAITLSKEEVVIYIRNDSAKLIELVNLFSKNTNKLNLLIDRSSSICDGLGTMAVIDSMMKIK